jgi:xanthine dehydrogenase small subunit
MTSCILNGRAEQFEAPAGRTVLDHLRLTQRLTGTKEGCAEGDCGACTVAIGRREGDGLKFTAVNGCIMLAADLDGCVVLTAEGLAQGAELAPVQRAMVELHGSQCGFCTPGFVMSLFAHLQAPPAESPQAENEALLDALSGNLCRCTGYRPILAAAQALPHAPDPRIPEWRAKLDRLVPDDTAPKTLEALDALLAAAPESRLTAGTTDIGVGIAKHGRVPPQMISLRAIPALREIARTPTHLIIGASATYSEILPYLERNFESFASLIRRIGSVQIRNLGSMGGNLCNASPIGDSAPCLIALDAVLILRSATGEREVKVEDFFTAYRKTLLRTGEYLRAIKIPYLAENQKFFAYKLAKRFDQDISTVAAAFLLQIEDGVITHARAGFGGMAATPLRATAIEAALIGKPCTSGTFEAAAAEIPSIFQPISDFRASAAYRLQAASGFLHRLGAQAQHLPADIWAL